MTQLPVLTLLNGRRIRVHTVQLFNAESVADIARLRGEAAKALGSTGLGFGVFGTPSLVLAGEAIAIGLLSSMLASSSQRAALEKLSQAAKKSEELRSSGQYFMSTEIANIRHPSPDLWFSVGPEMEMTIPERRRRMEIHPGIGRHPEVGTTFSDRFVHSGEEFVQIGCDEGPLAVRWAHVSSYSIVEI
jgi:hypothetical protein